MSYKIKGVVKEILSQQTGISKNGKEWCMQEFVIEPLDNNPQYPKVMCFQMSGKENIAKANLSLGNTVTVHFDISSRGYNGKYFTSLSAFGVYTEEVQQPNPYNAVPQQSGGSNNAPQRSNEPISANDLPF